MGILHPEVLKKYGIHYAGSFLELNLEILLEKSE
jgi:phenylalanyl-tRNA synthetase beta subunit